MSETISHAGTPENSDGLWAEFDALTPGSDTPPFSDRLGFIDSPERNGNVTKAEQADSTQRLKTFVDDMMWGNIERVRWMRDLDADNVLFQHIERGVAYLAISLLKRDELSANPYEVSVYREIYHGRETEVLDHRYAIMGEDGKLFHFMGDDPRGYAVSSAEIDGLYELIDGARVFNPNKAGAV